MGRWLPGTPLFLWPIKVVSWAGIRQKNVPKDTVCALCFKFKFFSSLLKMSDIFLGNISEFKSYFFCPPPFFFFHIIDISSATWIFSHHDNTIEVFVAENCVHYKNILGGWGEVQRKWCKPELQIITVCLPLWFAVCSCEIRCGIKISFSRLFFSFLSFLVSTGAIGSEGPSRCSIPWVNTASENFPCVDSKAPLACNRVTLL